MAYEIDYNFYGWGEYSVNYLGDDVIFKTKKESVKMVSITDCYQ